MSYDVIIIGGSYGGMAAALQLVRARRKVLVIDAGKQRNRFASHSYGFLGQDGVPPEDITAEARRQLQAYPTLSWREDEAVSLQGERDAFVIGLQSDQIVKGRRILIASGVEDTLPEIPGVADRWGQSIFHCPYCHGYELNQGQIGAIGISSMSVHQAEVLADWGNVTFFSNNVIEIDTEIRRSLDARKIQIIETGVESVTGKADVNLEDGKSISFDGLFIAPLVAPAGTLPSQIGVAMKDTPVGKIIDTDDTQQTSIPGIYACGDAGTAPQSVSIAVGNGALCGMQVHHSFIWADD